MLKPMNRSEGGDPDPLVGLGAGGLALAGVLGARALGRDRLRPVITGSSTPPPDAITAFHGTRNQYFDPSRRGFLPFTHFGSERAAIDRVRATGGRGGRIAIIPVRISGGGAPIRMGDAPVAHTPRMMVDGLARSGYITAEELQHITEPFSIVRADRDAGRPLTEFNGHSAADEAELRAARVLSAKGFSRIEYQNVVEDPGSTSFVVPDPANVEAARLVRKGDWLRRPMYTFDPESSYIVPDPANLRRLDRR